MACQPTRKEHGTTWRRRTILKASIRLVEWVEWVPIDHVLQWKLEMH